jgi:predicted nucleic acid-binding protein
MTTALDSNILSGIFSREPMALRLALALDIERENSDLVISPIVYCELLAHPAVDEAYILAFLSRNGVRIDFQFDDAVCFLADFFVGSHALLHADRLMTMDPKRYRQDFPEVSLLIPG